MRFRAVISPSIATALLVSGLLLGASWALVVAAMGAYLLSSINSKSRRLFAMVMVGQSGIAWLGFVLLTETYSDMRFGRFLVLLVILGAGLSILLSFVSTRRPGIPARILGVLCLGSFTIFLSELALRGFAAARPWPLFQIEDGAVEDRIRSHRLKEGGVRFGFPVNARGFYDDAFEVAAKDRVHRVVVVGDSFCVGVVPHHYLFTTQCERALEGVSLDTLAVDSSGPPEYIHLLRTEGLAPPPAAVLVSIYLGNDVTDARRIRRSHGLAESMLSRDHVLLTLVPQRLARIRSGVEAATDVRGYLDGDFIVVTSKSGEMRFPRSDLIANYPVLYPWLADQNVEEATFSEKAFMAMEIEKAQTICGERNVYRAIAYDLAGIAKLCRGIPLYVLLIPEEFQVSETLWRKIQSRVVGDLDRDRPQAELSKILDDLGVEYLDLLPAFRKASIATPGRRFYKLRDTHFNPAGNEVAGNALAKFLGPRLHR